jgi:hypothetical protein
MVPPRGFADAMDATITLLLGLAADILTTQPSVARRINPSGVNAFRARYCSQGNRGLV